MAPTDEGDPGTADPDASGHPSSDPAATSDGARPRTRIIVTLAIIAVVAAGLVGYLAPGGPGGPDGDASPSRSPSATAAPNSTAAKPGVVLAPAVTIDRDPNQPDATASTAPAIAAPSVDAFTAKPTSTSCADGVVWTITWRTTGADTVTIGRVDEDGQEHEPVGDSTSCAPAGTEFFLDANGPGGQASASAP